MMNELRYYFTEIQKLFNGEIAFNEDTDAVTEAFEPKFLVTAVELPTGAIELTTNNSFIKEKIDYILSAYDDDMRLKTNTNVVMRNAMLV